jgi:hypothetical protein
MPKKISLIAKNQCGFESLEYDYSNSKAQINLYIEPGNPYLSNKNHQLFDSIARIDKSNTPFIYKITGHRKVYRALLQLQKEEHYQWENNEARPFIEKQLEYLEAVLRQKLPIYKFWSETSQPAEDQSGIGQCKSSVTKIINDKNQLLFSKLIKHDNKKPLIEQINSIYHYALLNERACLDTISFEGVLRKSVDSLAIEDFKSMADLIAANKLPTLEEFVEMGMARLDVARLVFRNTDFHFHNYGVGKDKSGKRVLVVIDPGQAAWDLISFYYGIDPSKSYLLDGKVTAKPPILGVSFTAQDIINLPSTTDVEFHHAPLNSLKGKIYLHINLRHLKGIEKNPSYINEKYYFFLKSILFPHSFHENVHHGFMPNSKSIDRHIKYRKDSQNYTKLILSQCEPFWLYFIDHPEWFEKIQGEFIEFNQQMNRFFGIDQLMDLDEVKAIYEDIQENCITKLSMVLEKKINESRELIAIYQHFPTSDYRTLVKSLITHADQLENYYMQLQQKNIPKMKLMPLLDILGNITQNLNDCDKAHNLPPLQLIHQETNYYTFVIQPEFTYKLFKYVLYNQPEKIRAAIANNQLGHDSLNFIYPNIGLITATELALACGRKEIVEQLFQLEKSLHDFEPENSLLAENMRVIAKEIREAGRDYFLEHCKSKGTGFFATHNIEQRMYDIFELFQCLRNILKNINDFESKLSLWGKRLSTGLFQRSELRDRVMAVIEKHKTQERTQCINNGSYQPY